MTRIRSSQMRNVTSKNIASCNEETPTIGILPTARYSGIVTVPFQKSTVMHVVPYSNHSSYSELCAFVAVVKPTQIVPIVAAKTRGMFGVDVSKRSDMSCFRKYLREKQSASVSIPTPVKHFMNVGSQTLSKRTVMKRLPMKKKIPRRTSGKGVNFISHKDSSSCSEDEHNHSDEVVYETSAQLKIPESVNKMPLSPRNTQQISGEFFKTCNSLCQGVELQVELLGSSHYSQQKENSGNNLSCDNLKNYSLTETAISNCCETKMKKSNTILDYFPKATVKDSIAREYQTNKQYDINISASSSGETDIPTDNYMEHISKQSKKARKAYIGDMFNVVDMHRDKRKHTFNGCVHDNTAHSGIIQDDKSVTGIQQCASETTISAFQNKVHPTDQEADKQEMCGQIVACHEGRCQAGLLSVPNTAYEPSSFKDTARCIFKPVDKVNSELPLTLRVSRLFNKFTQGISTCDKMPSRVSEFKNLGLENDLLQNVNWDVETMQNT